MVGHTSMLIQVRIFTPPTAWDIFIPLGGIILAIITYLQQCFGSHYILPCGFKRSKVYEKVPVVGEAEIETTNM